MNTPNLEASSLSLLTSRTRRTPRIKRERRGVWQMTHHLRRRRPLLLLEQRAHGEVEAGRRRLAPAVHQPPEKQSRVSQFAYCNSLATADAFHFPAHRPSPSRQGGHVRVRPRGRRRGPRDAEGLGPPPEAVEAAGILVVRRAAAPGCKEENKCVLHGLSFPPSDPLAAVLRQDDKRI